MIDRIASDGFKNSCFISAGGVLDGMASHRVVAGAASGGALFGANMRVDVARESWAYRRPENQSFRHPWAIENKLTASPIVAECKLEEAMPKRTLLQRLFK